MTQRDRSADSYAALLLRLLLGALFIAHLDWKFYLLPGGFDAWCAGLSHAGYAPYVPWYVVSAEAFGAALLIPGILTRYVAVYAMPMMLGAAWFWLTRKGFYFTKAGGELPLVWLALLGLQAVLGDGRFALVRSPAPANFLRRPLRRRAA
ncbi:MAG: DoxX family protein [Caulobacteraceae bacterium]